MIKASALFLAGVLTAQNVAAQNVAPRPATVDSSLRMSVVTYISGQSVYVGAGRADGVREGTPLEVMRKGAVIATVKAAFLSSKGSSGEVVSSAAAPAVGDSVRYRVVVERASANAAELEVAQAGRPVVAVRRPPLRGHVGLRYLRIDQPNSTLAGITQPSADLHVSATHVGDAPVGFIVDARSRKSIGSIGTPQTQQTMLYEASMSLGDERGARLSAGRQYSMALSSVSLFDGVIAEVNKPDWSMGGFGGVQPDVATMGFSTSVREYGGYLQMHNRPNEGALWSLTAGAVSSMELGQVNRDFGVAQLTASGRAMTLYVVQEVDFNRGWKRAAGEPALTPTSTFAMLSARVGEALSLQGGVDNRRNVRLYRDYISPETEFDDAFRQGVWGGASLHLFGALRAGGDARFNRGGVSGESRYYTANFSVDPVTPVGFDAHLRSTRYETDRSTGWLHSWSVGAGPWRVAHLELNGGLRSEQPIVDSTTAGVPLIPLADARWIGFSLDVSLGRSWYLLASGTRDGAGATLTNQLYMSLMYRF